MDTCLACKSCAGQCPVKVDVPDFRSKFLALYHTRYHAQSGTCCWHGWNLLCHSWPRHPGSARQRAAGEPRRKITAAPHRPGPRADAERCRPDRRTRRACFAIATPASIAAVEAQARRAVIVVQDAFTSHFETGLVLDTLRLLDRLGFHPLLAPFLPGGKPLHVHGFLGRFHRTAEKNATMLKRLESTGIPLIGIDPAMTLIYRSEYKETLGEANSPHVYLLQEWLAQALASAGSHISDDVEPCFLLPHCTERTNAAAAMDNWERVFTACGAQLNVLPVGCCGMSGTYGHEAQNRSTSETIYQMSWGPTVARHYAGGRLMATGYSCRCQASAIDAVALPHPVQVLLALVGSRAAVKSGR
ncbi:(Fe-S)-binding protein [Paraburkholderia sp. BL9I2N2]|uniref:(Fe-S)-binding protein n=1 Tax=Paraburkholderia sp. BL9I2N2 TaxID=1938809 RepID=UPI001FB307F0|nr:(Fe-S)-binding protein [Paraburkholderia sp. BL9I2N2]